MKKVLFLTSIFLLLLHTQLQYPNKFLDRRQPEIEANLNFANGGQTSNEELVLQYLKNIQDNFSQNQWLVPAMEDNSGQTFNNALTAMAFILSGEKERAERILDFYAVRTDSANQVINKQNFFYNGQARGFYQNVDLNNAYNPFICDRWMGDNVWLLFAYKFYEKEYGFGSNPLYAEVVEYIKNLLIDFYIDDQAGNGGFVRHGWRWGPRNSSTPQNDYQLHELDLQGNPVGHEEGNIDAYAAFKLLGLEEKATKVKQWVDYRMTLLGNSGLPLDLYSWRALAFCNDGLFYKLLVNVPENDLGFRKILIFNDKHAVGFFSRDDHAVNNIWLDGTGQMACAFYSSGFADKGDFYTSQLDSFLINRSIGGTGSLALPYTANKTGGYDWVDVSKGFSSACAWYIFAKHKFNPFTLETNPQTDVDIEEPTKLNYKLEQNYPNPFNPNTTIQYAVGENLFIQLKVFDLLGREIATLVNETKSAGKYNVRFDANNLSNGVYLYSIKTENFTSTKKMILMK